MLDAAAHGAWGSRNELLSERSGAILQPPADQFAFVADSVFLLCQRSGKLIRQLLGNELELARAFGCVAVRTSALQAFWNTLKLRQLLRLFGKFSVRGFDLFGELANCLGH